MAAEKFRQVPLVCPGHSRGVVELNFSSATDDGVFLMSACLDNKPMLRRADTGDWVGTFEGHKGAVWGADIDRPALRAVTASADYTVKVWDTLSGDMLHSLEHKRIVKGCAFSSESKNIVTGGFDKVVRIFDMDNLDADPSEFVGADGNIRCVRFLPGNELIVAGSSDGKVRMWDRRSGEVVNTADIGASVNAIELSYDGTTLCVCGGKNVAILNSADLSLVQSFQLSIEVEAVSLHPSKETFVAGGSTDFWVRTFNASTGEETECLRGHHGPIHCLKYSPDGHTFASGSGDATIRIWQTKPELPGEV
mmetsp:Transcript_17363/g.43253  ORF Transcript_17363/g.43253 Transcript_17363/m.43253 type:complete len:308 (-) Transcript_17363:81-1004(-)